MQVERVRSFNRLVTVRVGALNDSYLGRGRPLGQARLLFEIGPDGAELAALRQRLELDSGYLSRLLRLLEEDGLAMLSDDATDRRRRRVALTPKRLAEHSAYDALSDDFARQMLNPLSGSQRTRLVAAMREVESLLAASAVTIETAREDSSDARECLASYFSELEARFGQRFDLAKGGTHQPLPGAPDCFLIARLEGRPVGCAGLRALDADTAEIKRMWVAQEARGLGLARRMLTALEDRARDAGMRSVRLDTNRTLTEARSLYEKSGYKEIERYNDNAYADFWFEKLLEP